MSRASTPIDHITAHAVFLREVDRLLAQVERVRQKREALDQMVRETAKAERPGRSEAARA